MKIVVDTNVIIQGADDENSIAFKIIREVIDGRLGAFATHQTMSENRQMLRKLVRDREYKNALEDFFANLQIVKVYQPLNVVTDPEDNKLIESAVSSAADYLVTRDREVLALEEYHGTKIVTPEEFWTKYKAESPDDGSAWSDWSRMIMGN
ncbi:MAG: putative toxin-antitoxin system toxin component, PIN family [Candidatus Doudnabacteria bacterium RIFCSPHIGHO2_02_FULL_48_21]|uniref:Putative toxin-antitoxin system toxin component, PIN family n=1 Tax=Candidatus Doudnabacteria bacterium RIFCSPLOWO2_02_FULL_48_13 TaxID=1817845 RepID=A0A1F5QA59_9BACT|nr:MAG: putative toxin-antitoxin system toxin component, PIN family [Candidatus Doudnabacteria bacterium RIFCSPHIGHO2_01_48_18]OGE78880.1 MAG: putative toxin-antitoxin system toxin component, PIN family [Candidatus Doudnabacteria bacterium RIFCSPHIGHO2_01_FULL_48_180]OGE91871.1 MAG: putative toxin-antitoxin system toxin component, PIN family [Candidatus Doudnabacteria bacterium RIFCSPHIGHO2_12_FULL_47_25]OGE94108.1 MAG: putative toxin-antitoxin system toxin component, PIN family [Candidatus Doud